MRNHLILLTLFFAQLALGQDKRNLLEDYPFQVVYAENAKLDNGFTIVGKYDYIKKDSQIQLDSGFLILMHHSEKLFEFSGDTLVSIESVLRGMPEYLKGIPGERPNIFYFSKYQNTYNGNGGSTQCVGNTYLFDGIYNGSTRINVNQPLTLHWTSLNENEIHDYTIFIRNIYDVLLDSIVLSEPKFDVNPSKYFPTPSLLVVQVISNTNPGDFTEIIGIYVDENGWAYIPVWDELKQPIDYLQAWYHTTTRGDFMKAREYLDQLNVNANHPFYRNLFEIWADR